MPGLTKTTVFSCSLLLAFSSVTARADSLHSEFGDIGLLLNIAAETILQKNFMQLAQDDRRSRRGRDYGRYSNSHASPNSHLAPKYKRGVRRSNRHEYSMQSYTSPPVRGGSSRRTRIIENPYSNRIVTGITLTGIDNGVVHIKNVISYPYRQLISPLSYSLSAYQPSRLIHTRDYIDYLSVQAKRKEYFTVTFHYD